MKSKLGHVYIYISNVEKSYNFYKKLFETLEYKEVGKWDWGFAFIFDGTSIWFEQTPKKYIKDGYHRKKTGLNHLAFRVGSKENVDKFFKQFLEKNKIKTLYNTPKPFPEYADGYYAVFFEDPDRIKLEVAFYPE